ncbi:endoplasmic reticulum-based factor for assembly of V-ATPase-domain-containing protein [Phyllosticta citrichinensis]|uniref:Endoplasmic reticulum-based factor for assembly of V-ATPase-domain-containing protein n=1 Tax=Phyllosticta citrichinensis TaxID=1130410 RepID=A0ABR1XHH6_9PEZI
MVLLTMTPATVAAVHKCFDVADAEQMTKLQPPSEPSLSDPELGKPISHGQLIDISEFLKARLNTPGDNNDWRIDETQNRYQFHLNDLLRGSRVYIPPPKPKPEPSNEYKQLMARLRRDEEARAYERMLNPPPPAETYAQRFSNAPPYPSAISPADLMKDEDDEVTYADINRQLALIINVLVSIIACSVAIWMAARYWSTPQRLALSMTGSGVVAFAEVAIYMGYLRRVKEAKGEEKKKVEKKEIAETWVIERSSEVKVDTEKKHAGAVEIDGADKLRKRDAKSQPSN